MRKAVRKAEAETIVAGDLEAVAHENTAEAIEAFLSASESLRRVQAGQDAADIGEGITRGSTLWQYMVDAAMFRMLRAIDHLACLIRLWDDLRGSGEVKDPDADPYRNRGYAYRGKLYLSVVEDKGQSVFIESDREFDAKGHGLRIVDLGNVFEASAEEGGRP